MTTYLGKSCSFGLPRVPFVNCRQFMFLVISFWFWGQNVGSDCISSWSLLIILLCLYRIGNRQLVASCRFVELKLSVSNLNRFIELVCLESTTESPVADSLNLYCLFRIWIGNKLPVADSLSLSLSNRQPATSCQLLICWTFIVRFESESATSCRLPILWTCLFRIGNWIGNRQPFAGFRFVELILSVWNLNQQPATSCRFVKRVCIESATESATGI